MDDFYKFPSTAHIDILPGVSVRDDKILSDEEKDLFFSSKVIVEEKIDGANLGISFDSNGDVRFQNRGNFLVPPFEGQWKLIDKWLYGKQDILFDYLGNDLILFGEWCYAKHSVYYSKLPDWFLAFDVFDKSSERFYSVNRRNNLVNNCSLSPVPELVRGVFALSDLKQLLLKSRVTEGPPEGIYLRIDDGDWLKYRAKLVRPAFVQLIEEHWTHYKMEKNNLASRTRH